MSYLRDERMDSSLPSIRSSVRAWEAPPRPSLGPRITTLEEREAVLEDRTKYGVNGYRDREIFYPRPPSPSLRKHLQATESMVGICFMFLTPVVITFTITEIRL